MGDNLGAFLRPGKASLKFFKSFFVAVLKFLKGSEPQFLASLSMRIDLLAYYDSSDRIKKYCIRKNGEFPSRIDHRDSLKSITVSKQTEKFSRLLSTPSSDASILHDGALWGWTPDGVYLRILIGDVSMLLTIQEVASLRGTLFATDKIHVESTEA